MSRSKDESIPQRLIDGINKRAKLPRGFLFWSRPLQIAWLRQNQKRKNGSGS